MAGKQRQLPTARLAAYATFVLLIEVLVAVLAILLWIVFLGGYRDGRGAYIAVQTWWVRVLFGVARPLLGVELNVDQPPDWPDGNVVVLSRHTNLADALLPAHLLLNTVERPIHYVLKRELRWLPSIDIYGHWLGNFFVSRGTGTEHELKGIRTLSATAEPDAGLVIFPEGTYATRARRAKIVASFRAAGKDDLADYAEELAALLPPKNAGTLALLNGQPTAPVIVIGHTGFDGLAEPGGLRRLIPLQRPVHVSWWLHSRDDVDSHPGGSTEWLRDTWQQLDQWVIEQRLGGAVLED